MTLPVAAWHDFAPYQTSERKGTTMMSEARIDALERMALACDRVEFSRVLADGRIYSGMATPEDVLDLIDMLRELRREVAVYEDAIGDDAYDVPLAFMRAV